MSGDSVDKGAPRPGAWDALQPGLAVSREPWRLHTAEPGRSFSLPRRPSQRQLCPQRPQTPRVDHKPASHHKHWGDSGGLEGRNSVGDREAGLVPGSGGEG